MARIQIPNLSSESKSQTENSNQIPNPNISLSIHNIFLNFGENVSLKI